MDHSDAQSSPLCKIESFRIVVKNDDGDFVPIEQVRGYAIAEKATWPESPIEIELRRDQTNYNNVYLEATTMGN